MCLNYAFDSTIYSNADKKILKTYFVCLDFQMSNVCSQVFYISIYIFRSAFHLVLSNFKVFERQGKGSQQCQAASLLHKNCNTFRQDYHQMAGDWGQLQTQGEEGGIMGKLIWFLFDVKPQSQAKTYNRNIHYTLLYTFSHWFVLNLCICL